MKAGETRTWVAVPLRFTPETMRAAGEKYLQWCLDNPLLVERTAVSNGEVITYTEKRARSPSIMGFCKFINCVQPEFYKWRKHEVLAEACEVVARDIAMAQFEGGQAGIFNTTITTRVLGLAEKVEAILSEAPPPAPRPEDRMIANLIHPDCTSEQLDAIYAAGKQPMLYSAAQIEAGMPWVMPDLDNVVEATPAPPAQKELPKPWER